MGSVLQRFRDYCKSNKKKKENEKLKFFMVWLLQFMFLAAFLNFVLGGVSSFYNPTSLEFIGGIKGLGVWGFSGVVVTVLNRWGKEAYIRSQVDLAYLHLISLIISALYLGLVPEDISIPQDGFVGQSFVFFPMILLLTSPAGVIINMLWALLRRRALENSI